MMKHSTDSLPLYTSNSDLWRINDNHLTATLWPLNGSLDVGNGKERKTDKSQHTFSDSKNLSKNFGHVADDNSRFLNTYGRNLNLNEFSDTTKNNLVCSFSWSSGIILAAFFTLLFFMVVIFVLAIWKLIILRRMELSQKLVRPNCSIHNAGSFERYQLLFLIAAYDFF